ncbi:MAG: efflux RND transporter permease subunit [Planctomycetota bacterium]|nr:efflux RND transporter permease subunit [Planctomycetota bacterium]
MLLTGTTLNVQSFIGLVILAGIVVNNAIVLVDYYNLLKREEPDLTADSLVVRGAVRRFRPIVMTSSTTILAMLPVAFGWGEGGELQAPMARVVVGGLTSGMLITLFAIPLLMHWRLKQRGRSMSVVDTEPASRTDEGAPRHADRELVPAV